MKKRVEQEEPEVVEEKKEEKALVVSDSRTMIFKQLEEQYNLPIDDIIKMIRSETPLTRNGAELAVRVAKSFGLPLQGINVITTSRGATNIYVNADGLRWRIHTDERGVKESTVSITHRPSKEEPWIETEARIIMGDGSLFTNIGVVPCQPGTPEVGNAMMKCLHPLTEVLTSTGWKYITDISKDDLVAQYDLTDKSVSFTYPQNIIETETVAWIDIRDSASVQVVTPNHDVVVDNEKIEASVLVNNEICKPTRYMKRAYKKRFGYIPISGVISSSGLPLGDDCIRLLVAHICDGCYRGPNRRVTFGFTKTRKIERMRQLLCSADIKYKESHWDSNDSTSFSVSGELFHRFLNPDKSVPMSVIINMDNHQAHVFAEELQYWDGTIHDGAIAFQQSESHKSIIDSVQIVCALHGIDTSLHKYFLSRRNEYKYGLRVALTGLSRSNRVYHIEWFTTPQKAYCVEVSDGAILTRYDGQLAFTGNCATKSKRRASVDAVGVALPIAEDFLEYAEEQRAKGKASDIIDGEFSILLAKPVAEPTNLAEVLAWVQQHSKTVDEATAIAGEFTVIASDVKEAVAKLKKAWEIK